MSLNAHTDIELTPTATKVPVPFVAVFDKKKPVMWICLKCGHQHFGETAPEVCPVCGHSQGFFEEEVAIHDCLYNKDGSPFCFGDAIIVSTEEIKKEDIA